MTPALKYECFIRRAFGVDLKSGDPAGLASADWFCSKDDINKIKIATGYAICKFNRDYQNTKKLREPDDSNRMQSFLNEVISANEVIKIGEIIEEYKNFEEELKKLDNLN